ncbi:CEI_1a_G0026270.mRNA.1.CDS.1 [Saccharomyces cerevisiae]|nr:EM14S01-3B_G0052440.mRNA.1.CDS.1 [Saccharomyces cerevisiae]CAI4385728.1 AMH_1a_G0026340.mRNA.1.CDS.1 [Saccharomyces cerevisiae]CAI4396876.1 CEI_1a_G0026270.mRNA.1.CDS.1 [Saccharomyces cerevisiae]CAI6600965.1 AMH_1a_G0026340.mRNA.1.CDS.1 [Saccharomyces cerevisiae]CAI7238707.1 CEI_1a_G0026270.mRNA.1.CDS.1 [Saccharomyces cerevisiae]
MNKIIKESTNFARYLRTGGVLNSLRTISNFDSNITTIFNILEFNYINYINSSAKGSLLTYKSITFFCPRYFKKRPLGRHAKAKGKSDERIL